MKFSGEIKKLVNRIAKQYNFDPLMILALIWQESHGDQNAVRFEPNFYNNLIKPQSLRWLKDLNPGLGTGMISEDTARITMSMSWGLMQIMGATAEARGFSGIFLSQLLDPETNITFGCKHLKHLADRFGKGKITPDILYAWNRGEGKLKQGTPAQREQYKFVKDVMSKYESLKKEEKSDES